MMLVGKSGSWELLEQADNCGKTGFSKVVRLVCRLLESFGRSFRWWLGVGVAGPRGCSRRVSVWVAVDLVGF